MDRSPIRPPNLKSSAGIPAWLAATAAVACLFFIGIRFDWLGPHLTQQALGLKLDKWQIGPLRGESTSWHSPPLFTGLESTS